MNQFFVLVSHPVSNGVDDMRADMAKVICERPRPGSREGSRPRKGYARQLQIGMNRALETGDSPPFRERRMDRYGWKRPFNEHLSPLRRFLMKQVGRLWDHIHSEICERIDRGNIVQKHILTHIGDFVIRDVRIENGELVSGEGWQQGQPFAMCRQELYVCPRTGLLRKMKQFGRRPRLRYTVQDERKRIGCTDVIRVSPERLCMKLKSVWELVAVRPVRLTMRNTVGDSFKDVVLGGPVSGYTVATLRSIYGMTVGAVARHVMGKKERRQYPIPVESRFFGLSR